MATKAMFAGNAMRAQEEIQRGLALLGAGDEAALDAFRAATRADAGDVDAHRLLGIAASRFGRLEDAEPAFQRAAALAPDDAELWEMLATARGSLLDFEGSIAAWREVVRLVPDRADAFGMMADLFSALGNDDEHLLMRERSVELAPSATGWADLATALARKGRHAAAVEMFRRAERIDPLAVSSSPYEARLYQESLEAIGQASSR